MQNLFDAVCRVYGPRSEAQTEQTTGLSPLANLPATLLPAAERVETALRSTVAAFDAAALVRLEAWSEERPKSFRRVAAASDFVVEQAVCDPTMLLDLAECGEPENPCMPDELRSQLQAQLEDYADEDELGRCLRRSHACQQLRTTWRDLTRRAVLAEACRNLSALVDACIDLAREWLHRRQCKQFGTLIGRRPSEL